MKSTMMLLLAIALLSINAIAHSQIDSDSLTKETILELMETLKHEITAKTDERIDSRIEDLMPEITDMIKQSNIEVATGLEQHIEEVKSSLSNDAQTLSNSTINKSSEQLRNALENNSSEIMLAVEERIKGEIEDLIQRVNDQNAIIADLQKRIKELEKE